MTGDSTAAPDMSPDISIVAACLNEADNVEPLARALTEQLTAAGVTFEIIFIDNGSTDGAIAKIKAICAADARIKLIVNNRNFGYLRSPTHAIYQASGRAVIGMCSDFQDPPALIPEFIARWRAGARIVLGVRRTEKASAAMRLTRALGYGFFARFGDVPLIRGATGFGLYDRVVIDCLRSWRDPEPFFRGMLVESGYPLETIPYDRPPRAAGRSKNRLGPLVDFSITALARDGRHLLRLPLLIAPVILGLSALALVLVLGLIAIGRSAGWALATAGLLAGFGLMFLFLGLMGEQVRVVSEMVRGAPLVTERERVNFP